MSASLHFIKTLELYLGKRCKVVYKDWDPNLRQKAFYGVLKNFDNEFQTWEGDDDKAIKNKKIVSFNHKDVSRIVMELGGVNA